MPVIHLTYLQAQWYVKRAIALWVLSSKKVIRKSQLFLASRPQGAKSHNSKEVIRIRTKINQRACTKVVPRYKLTLVDITHRENNYHRINSQLHSTITLLLIINKNLAKIRWYLLITIIKKLIANKAKIIS